MTKKGQDFVALLQELGCPHVRGLEGRDLDWLWETPASEFMEWICRTVTVENLLTEEEVQKWNEIPKGDRLDGQKLQEALAHLNDIKDLDNVGGNEDLEEMREELDVLEACISDLKLVKSNLSNHQGRLSVAQNEWNNRLKTAEANLSSEQQRLLRLNADFKSGLAKLQAIKISALSLPRESSISEADLTSLTKENENVADEICALIQKRFGSNDIRGRDVEEFENLVTQVHRLRFSLLKSEEKRVVNEAKREGAKEGLEETKAQLMLLANDMLPTSHESFQIEIKKLESEIQAMQCQLKGLIQESLSKGIEQKIARNCSKILAEDLQCKVDRQKYVALQLDVVLNVLLELSACQEVLGIALDQEEHFLKELEDALKAARCLELELKSDHEKNESKCKAMREKEAAFPRNTLVAWDKSLLGLHKLLSNRNIDPSMITYEDLASLMGKLEKACQQDHDQLKFLIDNWIARRNKICSLLKEMLTEINITEKSKGCELVAQEARISIKQAQAEVLKLETIVKDAVIEWEIARKSMAENPMIEIEKRLWKDFINNPEGIETTVESMRVFKQKKGTK